jgi:hypothetical protein
VRGRYGKRDDPDRRLARPMLQRLEGWLEEAGEPLAGARMGRNADGRPTLFLNLHPSAEEVEITLPGPGRLAVLAKTSTTGPGYHMFLCDLLHRLGREIGIRWQEPNPDDGGDETGYFYTRSAEAVEEEMLVWLRTVATVVLETLDQDHHTIKLSMPTNRSYPEHGPVVTPMGPRDRDWLQAVVEDPVQGIDLFPWWEPGLQAGFYRGRALTEMWQTVRWQTPSDFDEYSHLMSVHLDLCQAYDINPTLDYPWREWAELMHLIEGFNNGVVDTLNEDVRPVVQQRALQVTGPLIGYCRGLIGVDLRGGWSLLIPGSMIENWTRDGLWHAQGPNRAVWFCWWELQKDNGARPTARELIDSRKLPAGERLELQEGSLVGRAVFQPFEEEGKWIWNLMCFTAVDGNLAMLNIFIDDQNQRDWAMGVWRSLKHTAPTPEPGE